jgi:hypothetical protein
MPLKSDSTGRFAGVFAINYVTHDGARQQSSGAFQ